MKLKLLKSSNIYLTIFIIALSVLLFFSTECSIVNNSELNITVEDNINDMQHNEELPEKRLLKILTQNTMLIPFNFVAPAFNERTGCIIDLIQKDYEIVCLQEVFSGSSQNRIISSWHNMVYQSANDNSFSQWQTDYFND